MEKKNEITGQFVERMQRSIESGSFIKLTLSKPGGKDKDFKNVYARLIDLKGEEVLSFTLHYTTRDEVKNHPIAEALAMVGLWLGADFLNGDLFTLEEDVSIQFSKKRKARLFSRAASLREQPSKKHNRQKQYLIEPENNPYLYAMGIASAQGKILAAGQAKYRQINKYIEIIDSLLQQHPLRKNPHIVDMGSGKGYLTFALYDHLANGLGLLPTITGIELRQKLVDFCNELAKEAGYSELSFLAKDIHDFQPERIDMLIALHACDIATDIAIAKGVQSGAEIIIVAPCCHKQVRKQMACHTGMQAILRHGILEERQAELITDGIRSLLMEANGYQTKVFEFISTEHTAKNLMIVGTKGKKNEEAVEQVETIKKDYGIEYHYLERLLQG
ncbi:MAG: SAM-dependent methyltransferase [Lewinellaceae bacterium]|nr:SAM-dependent methyltransferase [Phaeodactylibacter sp.]MCB0614249.1 SAM-dependent methyltransferase [Phaeodactylibacter sp.]MCB9347723.1 SAM-dependent methyltransferase [Lewinellaceae bacterium]